MTKGMVYIGATIGGLIGGYLPVLFGADGFSLWSVLGSLAGGIIGIWAVYKFFN